MEQYPDENEEYELMYQEELEMLGELPNDLDDGPSTSKQAQLKNGFTRKVLSDENGSNNSILKSPQLSQISFGQQSQTSDLGGPVNRRLFGTPKGPQRGCSTPLMPKKVMPPIQEIIGTPKIVEKEIQSQLQDIGKRNKRRLERDLFGDIDDLYQNETYEDPMVKKARTDEEKDLADIERILETRKRLRETTKTLRKDDLSRLKALIAFKKSNLSYNIPHWPFLPLQRSDDKRIYVRFHSDEYETKAINSISAIANYGSLLGNAKQHVWNEANEIVFRRMNASSNQSEVVAEAVAPVSANSAALWVDKYKPRKYIDLLSDEMTNRSLLFWLKMWDKVVFGKEFHSKQQESDQSGTLNSFNKRTGKFETNGGWRQRKPRQTLNTNVDELGRPMQKVALLCGPPGLGKTTLAHTIARHAGYAVREINASDDRSPEAFKLALENGTQMTSVLNENRRPNCIILDEIDGAPRPSIEYLVKFVSDNIYSKARAKGGGKSVRNILKRPIICICNDVYDPALRALRQIAFVVSFPQIDSARLADRLIQIARKERLKSDFGSLIALAEKSGNDVRSCISTMQFFNVQKKSLTLQDVLNNNLGQKDRHQGLFDVWGAIFRIQRPKKQLQSKNANNNAEEAQVTMSDMSVATRVRNVLDIVHSGGDYERLMQGVYENYLQQKMPDPNMNGIVEALHWFCFTDMVQHQISQQQNYTVYPYMQFGFVVWHLLFASLAWPKIAFPTHGYEFNQKRTNQKNIFQSLRKGIATTAVGVGQGSVILLDTVPLLKTIISPQLRSVATQLLSQKEKSDLQHTIDVMVDLGITYVQVKSTEGHYVFQVEPDLDALAVFPGYPGVTLPYFSRRMIASEVELERIRRATPKMAAASVAKAQKKQQIAPPKALPNHLQRLQPKQIVGSAKHGHSAVSKDFFGRIQYSRTTDSAGRNIEEKSDPIVKSPIWYRYKEGFNNAVRRDIHMNELL